MGGLDRRLERLEGHAAPREKPEVPIEVRIHLKAVERHQARERGEDPPPYSADELAALHEEDLDTLAGGGVVGILRNGGGWQGPEAQTTLNEWEEAARWRVEQARDLPPERWGEVYELD